ncbi:hypothetical protein D3C72_798020 [compost metagenome]
MDPSVIELVFVKLTVAGVVQSIAYVNRAVGKGAAITTIGSDCKLQPSFSILTK